MVRSSIGRFQIERELASSNIGSLYRAKDPKSGRTLVLRTLRTDSDTARQLLPEFQCQAKSAAALNSPNIAAVIGGGIADSLFFVVQEYVEGNTLRSMLGRGRTLPPWEAIDLTRQICSGLEHAHHRGIVHPNLHPGNVMVELDGTAKIMDFGVPKTVSAASHPGKPDQALPYAAPEQVRGEPVDSRANLFSWGAILYEAFTGSKPFAGQDPDSLRRGILETTPPAPQEVCPALSPAISAVIMKALAKDPGERYQRASELLSALETYKQAEPAASVPPRIEAPAPPQPAAAPAMEAPPALPAELPAPQNLPPAVPVQRPPTPVVLESALESAVRPNPSVPATPETTLPQIPHDPIPAGPARDVQPPARPVAAVAKVLSAAATRPRLRKRQKTFVAWVLKRGLSYAAIGMALLTIAFVSLGAIYFVQQQVNLHSTPLPAPSLPAQPAPDPSRVKTAGVVPSDPEPAEAAAPAPRFVKPARRKAPEPVPIPASLATTGELAVTSIPEGALVRIDGQSAPNWLTPFMAGNLNPGPHTVVLNKTGFTIHTQTAQVEAGRRSLLGVSLTELGATVFINSDPSGATVLVDGQDSGKLTPTHVVLPKGKHAFVVRKFGFFEYTGEAQLTPGQNLTLSPALKMMGNTDDIKTSSKLKLFGNHPKDMASLQIKTRPKGAHIVINSRDMDRTTPAEFFLHPGYYEIQITASGYKPLRKMVSLDTGAKVFVIDEELPK